MDQARKNEPARAAILPDRLSGLQRMNGLGKGQIWIAVVNKRIKPFQRFPNAHSSFVLRRVLGLFREYELERLLRVVEPVKLLDGITRLCRIVAIALGVFNGAQD